MVEHRSHSAGLEYDASAGWKLRKLGRDIRRRRRHLRLVNDRAVSRHDANLRFRHRHVQPGKILHVGSPLPMTKPILSASAEEPRPLPDVEKKSPAVASGTRGNAQSAGTHPFSCASFLTRSKARARAIASSSETVRVCRWPLASQNSTLTKHWSAVSPGRNTTRSSVSSISSLDEEPETWWRTRISAWRSVSYAAGPALRLMHEHI